MALHDFLGRHRSEILERTHRSIAETSPRGSDSELIDSLPELLDDIVAVLREDVGLGRETAQTLPRKTATVHGRQRLRLGFTITELVHDYGALCQAITGVADGTHDVTTREYQVLNQALDTAIAQAVSEYAGQRELEREGTQDRRATTHLGFVAHELRNALASAMLAFDVIKRGDVGVSGRTSQMLERSLKRAQGLVDRSLAEVRLRPGLELVREATTLHDILEDVEITAAPDVEAKRARISIEGDAALELSVDRPLMTSALGNLVQNAIKYSPVGTEIHVRCTRDAGLITIEVEDACGGLSEDKVDALFNPFVRARDDTAGVGLGLPITRQAIEAHGGRIHVRDVPGHGCVFVVELPT